MQLEQVEPMGIQAMRPSHAGDRLAVNSRRRALDRLWAAFRAGLGGPVLITGEPGAGKSWLAGRFVDRLPASWHSAEVDVSSALDGVELLRLIGDQLGLEMPDRLGAARLTLGAGLRDADVDGRNWVLVVNEVQHASAALREEIQALAHGAGQPGGFAAILFLGRTELARELAGRRASGWSHLLGLHIHLPPLDVDEARALLGARGDLTESELETLHRDALGNPRAMLRMASARWRSPGPAAFEPTDSGPRFGPARLARPRIEPPPIDEDETETETEGLRDGLPALADDIPSARLPSLIPARPPIRMEEGLVEVGWEGDLEAEPTRPESPMGEPESAPAVDGDRNEEMVEDRYAALQAWAEWSRNRERPLAAAADPDAVATISDDDERLGPLDPDPGQEDASAVPVAALRPEPPQDFAPYSQLFSRLRHSL